MNLRNARELSPAFRLFFNYYPIPLLFLVINTITTMITTMDPTDTKSVICRMVPVSNVLFVVDEVEVFDEVVVDVVVVVVIVVVALCRSTVTITASVAL